MIFAVNKSTTRNKTSVTIDPDSRYPYGSAPPSYTQMASVATLPISENIARNRKMDSAVNVDQTSSTSNVTNLSSEDAHSSDSIQTSTKILLLNSTQSADATKTPIQDDVLNAELHNKSISPEPIIRNCSDMVILNVTRLTKTSKTFLNGSIV